MKYYLGDQIKTNEIGASCSTYGVEERCIQDSGRETFIERDHLKDPGVNERMILRRIFRKWDGWAWAGLIWLRI